MVEKSTFDTQACEGWRFGACELHLRHGSVVRGAKPIPVFPQELKLLLLIVRAGGNEVKRQEIADALWGGSQDTNLHAYVARIHKKLGEGAIETIRGSGCRLKGPWEPLGSLIEKRCEYLAQLLIEAEVERQTVPDADWDKAYGRYLPDVRECLEWALAKPFRRHVAIRLAGAAGRLLERHAPGAEARQWMDRALERIDNDVNLRDAARVVRFAGTLWQDTDRARGVDLLERAALLYRSFDDRLNLGQVLVLIGNNRMAIGQHDQALSVLQEAEKLVRNSGQDKAHWNVLNSLGVVNSIVGNAESSLHLYMEARELAGRMNDNLRMAIALGNIGELEFSGSAADRAIKRATDALKLIGPENNAYRLRLLVNLATYECSAGLIDNMITHATEACLIGKSQSEYWQRLCVQLWAYIAAGRGLYSDAALLFGFVEGQFERHGEIKQRATLYVGQLISKCLAENLTGDSIVVWMREGRAWTTEEAVRYVGSHLTAAT